MKDRFDQLGWVLASSLGALMLAGGFQSPTDKTGVVDIAKVVEGSSYGKSNQDEFSRMKAAREGLLEFIDTNRVLTAEQAQRLRELSLKPSPTDAEKAEADRVKADITASATRMKELTAKASLTAEERTLMDDYARRSQAMSQTAQRWYGEFTNEMQDWAEKRKTESVTKAREAIQSVARQQGYTIVFEVGVAPYGANDLTDAALQAMNAQK